MMVRLRFIAVKRVVHSKEASLTMPLLHVL